MVKAEFNAQATTSGPASAPRSNPASGTSCVSAGEVNNVIIKHTADETNSFAGFCIFVMPKTSFTVEKLLNLKNKENNV